jgi:hypothetical protein
MVRQRLERGQVAWETKYNQHVGLSLGWKTCAMYLVAEALSVSCNRSWVHRCTPAPSLTSVLSLFVVH